MRSELPNLLSIAEFGRFMGINLWRLAGFGVNVPVNQNIAAQSSDGDSLDCCSGTCFLEYMDQNGSLSRFDISSAIMQAEDMFQEHIHYYPAPKYTALEKRDYPHIRVLGEPDTMYNAKGQPKSVDLRRGYMLTLGAEICELLDTVDALRVNPLELETEGGPLDDSFEFDVTVPLGTTPDQLHVYFTEADRFDEPRDQWEIRPLTIKIDGTTATVKGGAYLLVSPARAVAPDADCLDTLDNDNYVLEVEVWRCTVDATDQGVLGWDMPGNCATPPCTAIEQGFCAMSRGADPCSWIAPLPAEWNADSESWKFVNPTVCRVPDYVKVNYTSGIARIGGRMDRMHGQIISYLAASLLDCELCSCGCTGKRLAQYRDYPKTISSQGEVSGAGNTFTRTEKKDLNPFGERTGAARAWLLAEPKTICI